MLVRNFLPPSCGLPAFLDSFTRAGLMTGTFNMEKLRMQASQHIAKKDGVNLSLSLPSPPPPFAPAAIIDLLYEFIMSLLAGRKFH
jgi:hypothetical protein